MKHFLLTLAVCMFAGFAHANVDVEEMQNAGYESTSTGYLALPKQAKDGILVTNNRHSELYMLRNNQLETLVSSPGCGRYTNLNKEKTLLGFKSIDEYMNQAPAILDLATGEVTLLEPYTNLCGQVSFSNDGTMAYTVENTLVINRKGLKTTYDLGYYTNIVNLSPDGRSVAFSDPDGRPVVMDLQKGSRQLLSTEVKEVYNPKWSPDSKKIIYEESNMTLYVYDAYRERFDYLSKGADAQWLNDSENIVFTTAEYENDDVFQFVGSSVNKMSVNTRVKDVIVPTSKDMPQEVAVLDGNRLAITYSHVANRRVVAMPLETVTQRRARGINSIKSTEEVLFALPAYEPFAQVEFEIKNNPQMRRAPQITDQTDATQASLIGANEIPYLNQNYDVPVSYAGCYGYGPSACGPSSAVMILAYYGLLNKKAYSSRYGSSCPWGATNYYSWYVGQQYTSPVTGHVFSDAASASGCYAKGGFGFTWNSRNGSSGSPRTTLANFFKKNGVTNAAFSYGGRSDVVAENKDGYPYAWCITSGKSNGHVICPFRSNAYYSGGYFYSKTGSVVCQDPYGNANRSPWKGDGRRSTYDFSGYNNGFYTMYNAWGCKCRYSATPTITRDPSELAILCTIGKTNTKKITVTGKNLSAKIKVAVEGAGFTVDKTSLSKSGGTISVTFTPAELKTYSGTITLTSTDAKTKTIKLTGNTRNPVPKFEEGWNFSQNSGKKGDWMDATDGYKQMRNFAFGAGKLYVVNPQKSLIHVIESQTGKLIKNLDNTGISGGNQVLAGCAYVDGKLLACNTIDAAANDTVFKVYIWDNDDAKPRVLLERTDLVGKGYYRMGDNMHVKGNLTDGLICLAATNRSDKTRLLTFKLTNGVCETYTKINLLDANGKAVELGRAPRVIPVSNGRWWGVGSTSTVMLFNEDGTFKTQIPEAELGGVRNGTGFDSFTFKGSRYGLITTYEKAGEFKGGRVALVDATTAWKSADKRAEYPANGLGTTANKNAASTHVYAVTHGDEGIEMWMMVRNQGIAYFKHGTVPTYKYDGTDETPTNPSDTIDPTEPVVPDVEVDTNLVVNDSIQLEEVWNYSQKSGKTADWIVNGKQVTQDMAVSGGKLYVVHRDADAGENKVHIVDAYRGDTILGELNMTGCAGGRHTISSIEKIGDDDVVACNLVTADDTDELKVYYWEDDHSEPRVILSTTQHENLRAGDNFLATGTIYDGRLYFTYADKMYYYTVEDTVCSPKPTSIALTQNGKPYTLGESAVASIVEMEDGSFWISGKDQRTTHFDAKGEFIEEMPEAAVSDKQGTAAQFFTFGTRQFAVLANYLNTSIPAGETSVTLADGSFTLTDITHGVENAQAIANYPAAGLGGMRNTSFRSTICTEVTSNAVNIWVLYPLQGAAYYRYHSDHFEEEDTDDRPGGEDAGDNPDTALETEEITTLTLSHDNKTLWVEGVNATEIVLHSVMGQEISTVKHTNQIGIVGLQGVYMVTVTDTTGAVTTGKVLL